MLRFRTQGQCLLRASLIGSVSAFVWAYGKTASQTIGDIQVHVFPCEAGDLLDQPDGVRNITPTKDRWWVPIAVDAAPLRLPRRCRGGVDRSTLRKGPPRCVLVGLARTRPPIPSSWTSPCAQGTTVPLNLRKCPPTGAARSPACGGAHSAEEHDDDGECVDEAVREDAGPKVPTREHVRRAKDHPSHPGVHDAGGGPCSSARSRTAPRRAPRPPNRGSRIYDPRRPPSSEDGPGSRSPPRTQRTSTRPATPAGWP